MIAIEDGYRFLCDAECRDRFRQTARAHGMAIPEVDPPPNTSTPARSERPVPRGKTSPLAGLTVPAQPEDAHVPGRVHFDEPSSTATGRLFAGPAIAAVPGPWIGLGAAALGLGLGLFGGHPALAVLSTVATVFAAGTALARSFRSRRDTGLFAWALGPTGAALAAVAALVGALGSTEPWWPLIGAAMASAAMVGRAWLDAWARRPVEVVVAALVTPLPTHVSVPADEPGATPTDGGQRRTEVDRVRTGEDVFARAGEIVAVDGVVKAGEATALLHPSARTPVRRVVGDPLLAGARIVDGSVRLVATRVGRDRGLVRPARFGSGRGRDAAPIARLAELATRWGGVLAIGFALSGLLLAGGTGFSAQLSAAAAVLLAAPLLAVRRSAEAPLIAAAAIAGARGIVFQSARALDRAGRVTFAALCGHGTITDGQPEVVEMHALEGGASDVLIALAAAAESAAEPHAIAHAIRRFADARGVPGESVRHAAYVPGRGVTALTPSGEALVIGSRQLLLSEGVSVAVADADAARAESRGRTAIFLGLEGHVRAVFSLEDELRTGARAAVQRLVDLGIEVVLLSGDDRGTVETLAKGLGVDHIKAELVPEECGAEVRRLRESGGAVAAVGRPRHDDAALAAADVPVVLGAAGGPSGEYAIALVSEDVRDAAAALWIARAAHHAATRDSALATIGGSALVALGATGLVAPGVIAIAAIALDAWALPAGARLLRRVALRLPERA